MYPSSNGVSSTYPPPSSNSQTRWTRCLCPCPFSYITGEKSVTCGKPPLSRPKTKPFAPSLSISIYSCPSDDVLPSCSLLQKLAHDLRTTLFPVYESLLKTLLDFLPRPIAAPALTALLATLSALFRYLLVPCIHLDLLQQTWSSFHSTLPKCNAEVQRAAAEVWASVLRRLKTSAREKAVILMANNLTGVEDASAWMLIFACKVRFFICVSDNPFFMESVFQSISQTLHSTSASLVSPVVDVYLSSDNPDALYTLLRRTLTSLTHHCKDVEGFSSVTEPIIAQFCCTVSETPRDEVGVERVRRMLHLASVLCGARQGSRLTGTSILFLLSHLIAFF